MATWAFIQNISDVTIGRLKAAMSQLFEHYLSKTTITNPVAIYMLKQWKH